MESGLLKPKYLSFLNNKIVCILKLSFLMLPSLVESTISLCINKRKKGFQGWQALELTEVIITASPHMHADV
jgi:hypothetical protein